MTRLAAALNIQYSFSDEIIKIILSNNVFLVYSCAENIVGLLCKCIQRNLYLKPYIDRPVQGYSNSKMISKNKIIIKNKLILIINKIQKN